MQEVIVFLVGEDTAVMAVANGIGMTTLEIGEKDVPAGTPFWIVDASLITDEYAIDASGMGDPSGYGRAREYI